LNHPHKKNLIFCRPESQKKGRMQAKPAKRNVYGLYKEKEYPISFKNFSATTYYEYTDCCNSANMDEFKDFALKVMVSNKKEMQEKLCKLKNYTEKDRLTDTDDEDPQMSYCAQWLIYH